MKRLIAILLMITLISLAGCAQQNIEEKKTTENKETTTTPTHQETTTTPIINPETSAATISNDLEIITQETAKIDTDSGDAITPITDAELTID